jgi:hypothetical protein
MYLTSSRGSDPMPHSAGRNRKHGRSASPSYLQLVHDTTARVAPAATTTTDARRRVVIVPLDAPAAVASTPIPRLAPEMNPSDRRQRWPGRDGAGDPAGRLVCPSCSIPARVDVVDLRQKRLHLSCDRCYRMWQDQVRAEDVVPVGLQRVR